MSQENQFKEFKQAEPAAQNPEPNFEQEIDWDKLPYGKLSNSELAQSLGVSVRRVAMHRRRRVANIEWDVQPFGQMPDSELASQLGVSESVVAKRRRARKIPSWQSQHPETLGRTPLVPNWDEQPLGQLPDTGTRT